MEKLKDIRVLTAAAFLVAIATVLGFFKFPVTELIEIRFQFLVLALGGYLFGPGIGGIIGALSDVLGYLVKPTGAFFPGFTLASIVVGALYGACLYRKEVTLRRVILTELLVTLVRSVFLNTINLMILYGGGFLAILSARILKTIVMFPINVALLYFVLTVVPRILPREHR